MSTPAAPTGQEPAEQPVGQEPAVPNTPENPTAEPEKTGIESLPDWAQAEIKKLRSESAKLSEYEKTAEERRLAELSEVERAREEAKAAAAERDALVSDLRREKILNAARSKGTVDPDAVFALLDRDSIQWDGAQSANLDDAIDSLLAAKSYLKGVTAPAAGHASVTAPAITPPTPGRTTEITLAALRKMSREQIMALPREVRDRALSGRF